MAQVNIYIEDDDHRVFKALAKSNRISINELIRTLCRSLTPKPQPIKIRPVDSTEWVEGTGEIYLIDLKGIYMWSAQVTIPYSTMKTLVPYGSIDSLFILEDSQGRQASAKIVSVSTAMGIRTVLNLSGCSRGLESPQ